MPLNKKETIAYIRKLKKDKDVSVFAPYKYFEGLKTKKEVRSRFNDLVKAKDRNSKDPDSFAKFSTDFDNQGKRKKTRESKYTKRFYENYGRDAKSLSAKAKATGIPLNIIKKVYRKGVGAHSSGHRVGATAEQWGYARVHSFATLGCTTMSTDFKLFQEAVDHMKKTKEGRKKLKIILSNPISCEKKKLKSEYYQRWNAVPYIQGLKKEIS